MGIDVHAILADGHMVDNRHAAAIAAFSEARDSLIREGRSCDPGVDRGSLWLSTSVFFLMKAMGKKFDRRFFARYSPEEIRTSFENAIWDDPTTEPEELRFGFWSSAQICRGLHYARFRNVA
jgi:hypothetical protein